MSSDAYEKLSVAQQLRKALRWCLCLIWRFFAWNQHDLPGKMQARVRLKSQRGSCNCALPMVFLPFPGSTMGSLLNLTLFALVTSSFGESAKYLVHIPTPVLAVATWKALMSAFLLMLQPRLQVILSTEFYVTPRIKWWSKSLVITGVLRPQTLQIVDIMGSCFWGGNFSITLIFLTIAIFTNGLIFYPITFFPTKVLYCDLQNIWKISLSKLDSIITLEGNKSFSLSSYWIMSKISFDLSNVVWSFAKDFLFKLQPYVLLHWNSLHIEYMRLIDDICSSHFTSHLFI